MRVLISDPAEGGSLNCTETTAGLRSRLRSACMGTEHRGPLLPEHFVVNVPLIISIDQFAVFADNPLRTFTLLMNCLFQLMPSFSSAQQIQDKPREEHRVPAQIHDDRLVLL